MMDITVSLPAEYEPALRRRAAATGQDVESFARRVLTDELAGESIGRTMSHEEFKVRLHSIIQGHGIRHGHFDDSRESIYAGCGE